MRVLILFVISFLTLGANSIWWYSNFEDAHKEALKSSKNIMVLLIEKNSPYNKTTLIDTFMNQDYIDDINKKYISVIVTKDQELSYPIEMLYTVDYPSVFFLDNLEIYLCKPLYGLGNVTSDRLREHLSECDFNISELSDH